jgi:hypothetical protein
MQSKTFIISAFLKQKFVVAALMNKLGHKNFYLLSNILMFLF